MEDINEGKPNLTKSLSNISTSKDVYDLLDKNVTQTSDAKTAIDLLATKTALQQQETLEKIVTKKEEELLHEYEAKRIKAEIELLKQEKEKELAELDKEITKKRAEVEKLKAESNKAEAFYKSNEEILSCIGIKSAKSLRVMYSLMPIAIFVFLFVRFIALPLTIGGKIVEILIDIVGGICKKISNNALKIIISVLVIALLVGGGFCAYYFGGQLIA